jgi:superfamily II DNA or RNA helicase
VIARIKDNHWIYLDQITQGSEDALVYHFSVKHPRAFYIDTNAEWDGFYRKYSVSKQRLALPFLNELKVCCTKHQIPLEIDDQRPKIVVPLTSAVTKDMLSGVVLEDYQINAALATLKEEIGIILSTTGSGKTEIMCMLVKLFGCSTVIITEQRVILDQIVKRLELRDVVSEEDIGMFCSGHMPNGQIIIVGNIQSVSAPTKPKFQEIKVSEASALKSLLDLIEKEDKDELIHILPRKLVDTFIEHPEAIEKLKGKYLQIVIDYFKQKRFQMRLKWYQTRIIHAKKIQDYISHADMLLVDEADLAVSVQYTDLCRRIFNGRRRYGLTGTAFDKSKPVENLFLRENLGNVIHEVPREEVQERGRIIPVKCFFLGVGLDGDKKDVRAFDIAMKEEIIENEKFQKLVASLNAGFVKERNLILIDTSPIESLGLALQDKIPNSKFLYNKSSMPERWEFIKKFEKGELQCLIGGKIFKRGLDLSGGVDNLIIIGGGKQWSNINQMVGRGVRINSRGWARVFCFFFLNNKYLYHHSRENLKAVVDLGYTTKICLNGKQFDAENFINSRFRLPKGV